MKREVGRLAFRQEGSRFNAYYAMPNTMQGRIFLGCLHVAIAEDPPSRDAFIQLMKNIIPKVIKETIGEDIIPGELRITKEK